jgi:putative flippase GtrA
VLKPAANFIWGRTSDVSMRSVGISMIIHLPLSHLSLAEGLRAQGFKIVEVIDRFLSCTIHSDFLINIHPAIPALWKIFERQFVVIKMPSRMLPFILFLVVGGVAGAANIAARLLFNNVFSYKWAVLLAFPVGLFVAFVLNRTLVFRNSRRSVMSSSWRFILVNIIALLQVWLISIGLARLLFPWIGFVFHAELVAHVIAVGSPAMISFLAHKHFSFRPEAKLRRRNQNDTTTISACPPPVFRLKCRETDPQRSVVNHRPACSDF